MDDNSIQIIHRKRLASGQGPEFLSVKATEPVRRLHQSLPAYRETPLVALDDLAQRLGVKGIYVKDESQRFGLKAFKGLGGVYVTARAACERLGLDIANTTFPQLQSAEYQRQLSGMVFATATDGNHGKGIAWAAGQLGCQAKVYMPKGSSPRRAQAIRDAGMAEVTITGMGYDDTVRYAEKMSKENGWVLLQDTSWPGYEEIPRWIIQGYTTMAWEAVHQLEPYAARPTHVFLQAGVGAMAGGVTGFLANYYGPQYPEISIVEPREVACIFESARQNDGKPHLATGSEVTIMAGLNCAEPCTVTWPVLKDLASHYLSCPDYVSARGMRLMAAPGEGDRKIVSGESGAVTLGALSLLMERQEYEKEREVMGLGPHSVILLFNTEGDTDPQAYRDIVYDGKYPMPGTVSTEHR